MRDIKFTHDEALQLLLMINRNELLKANTAIIHRIQDALNDKPVKNGYLMIADAMGMPQPAPPALVDIHMICQYAASLMKERDELKLKVGKK